MADKNCLHERHKSDQKHSSDCNDNTHLSELIARQRRSLLKGSLGIAVATFLNGPLAGCSKLRGQSVNPAAAARPLLGFAPVAISRSDSVKVPQGYSATAFMPWGTPISSVAPAYRPDGSNSGADQELQVGSHHDGMHFFPIINTVGSDSTEGLLVINHEYVDANILHAKGPTTEGARPVGEVQKELAAHGVSVLHVAKDDQGSWSLLSDSKFNRRITGASPMEIRGAVRGASKLQTKYSAEATHTRGTLNNCGNGVTPWNTYLAAEENWAEYFVNRDQTMPREHRRYGVKFDNSRYRWDAAESKADEYARFDL